jgi:hypothetical protein
VIVSGANSGGRISASATHRSPYSEKALDRFFACSFLSARRWESEAATKARARFVSELIPTR